MGFLKDRGLLRDFIRYALITDKKMLRETKKPRSKGSTIVAMYRKDLELILYWVQNNRMLKGASEIEKRDNRYTVRVTHKGSKSDLRKLVKDRFGVFAEVI